MNLFKKISAYLLYLSMMGCGLHQTDSGIVIDLTYMDLASAFSVRYTGGDTIWMKNYNPGKVLVKAFQKNNYLILTEPHKRHLDSLLTKHNYGAMDSTWVEPLVDGSHYVLFIKPASSSSTYLHNSVNSDLPTPVAKYVVNITKKSKWLPCLHNHSYTSEKYLFRHGLQEMAKEDSKKYLLPVHSNLKE
ncbi:hypothetical protein LXM25_04415 [Dyadobacter sp. LJ53]|uniref:hypothetical protein n=1 Tax=Dyadobacter chenwenxiniae TaxID=2906456 RepID=UPI001F2B6948|nr:hypothetical protein [Dyadobacter chenwenxiniae]MCF0049289.1 hypothetical protein [Dyadobacter chenwenxiniae]